MMQPIWQVDAFSARRFGGNPAAVVLLDGWLPEQLLLWIAAENNLSETAFIVGADGRYEIRWFTPVVEVPLCGHATLASAWVVMNRLEPSLHRVVFKSASGELSVQRHDNRLVLDFPAGKLTPVEAAADLTRALGGEPREVHEGFQWLVVYDDEDDVRALAPDMNGLLATGVDGVIATAPGQDCDFVSRFFAPALGVPEDPVTGSAHTLLTPYWAQRLGRDTLTARQISARGGQLWCELAGERVLIGGEAHLYLEGSIEI